MTFAEGVAELAGGQTVHGTLLEKPKPQTFDLQIKITKEGKSAPKSSCGLESLPTCLLQHTDANLARVLCNHNVSTILYQ